VSPKLTEVIGTNRCRLGIATRGRTLVVTSVLDNLVKGAAGGAVQWMNRLFGLPDATGLELPGLGWF
jgi:N-acetyl-gamma-glutamyl-phosphate reductase